ncbi:MAG: TPM domain-containing protein [Xenococcaceae cyanobacterium MO_188.B19]|nr:TPM domain-containing protein [Xenococcaceae cyanobacterium MO_188.B19]
MNQKNMGIVKVSYWLKSIILLGFFSLLMAAPAIATGVYDLDSPNTQDVWVIDQADEISLANQNKLTGIFKKTAQQTGQEIRMVAVRRLDYGETIDSLADEIFTTWYPSAEEQANQTLLVMDTLTNNVALRTGTTATETVTPDIAESIVEETVGYNLRKGNKYNQAFIDASDRLVALLSGEEDPGPPVIEEEIQVEGTFTKAEDTDAGSAFVWVIVILIVATVVPMVTYFWYVGFPGN